MTQHTFDGFLFDMDGTLIASTDAVAKHWADVAKENSIPAEVMAEAAVVMHGTRSIDILKLICPEKATLQYAQEMEARLPENYASSAKEIPGARAVITALSDFGSKWGIVTSGTNPLVTGWLSVLGLPKPPVLVTAELVAHGKPHPEPYLAGRAKLGLQDDGKRVLVAEDSPTGIKAGKAAGCLVVGLLTSSELEDVKAAKPDWIVKDMSCVKVLRQEKGGEVVVEITEHVLDA